MSSPEAPFIVLSGFAGVGKTALLGLLRERGEPVLDLEALAGHSGSAFGGLGRAPQPSRKTFLATLAGHVAALPAGRPCWVEDEGPFIGSLPVPSDLAAALAAAPEVEIVAPAEARLDRLVATYGHLDPADLVAATERMRRRLGPARAASAIARFTAGDPRAAIEVLLPYFDAGYAHRSARHGRQRLATIDSSAVLDDRHGCAGMRPVRGP